MKTGENAASHKFFQATFSATRPSKCFVIKTRENAAQNFARLFFGDSTFQIFVIKTGENAAQFFPSNIFGHSTFQMFCHQNTGKCCPNFPRLFFGDSTFHFSSSKQGKMLPKFFQAKFSAIRLSKCFVIETGENAAQIFCLAKYSEIRLSKLCQLNRTKCCPFFS